jgi:predicted flap endonuclease-1-like 5' DNA nuclease
MTYLLLQTFLLLLASYFLGAFVACLAKRTFVGSQAEVPAHVLAPVDIEVPVRPPVIMPPQPIRARVMPHVSPIAPRAIDPVQPKIDVLRRPEPRPAPKVLDPSRFERALLGPDPNEGIPRRAIIEIRPSVLKPVTGIYRPPPPKPVEPPKLEVPEPEPPVEEITRPSVTLVEAPTKPERIGGLAARLRDATTAAAAGAVAAAKAAAAASVTMSSALSSRSAPVETEPTPAPEEVIPEVSTSHEEEVPSPAFEEAAPVADIPAVAEKPAKPEPQIKAPPVVSARLEGGDDFQRIRAIDADIEQRLKAGGVNYFEDIAQWTLSDAKHIGQELGIPGRIDREQWVEQAQILAKGGETYYSRNRLAALKAGAAAPAARATASERQAKANAPESSNQSASSGGAEQSDLSGVAAASQGRSVAEMAAAAAAAIAAASASVTRGLKPIEPISPLSKVDPKISIPARITDAIREKGTAAAANLAKDDAAPAVAIEGPQDDLKRIRGIGVLIEKRLNALGIGRYEQIANWTSSDIDRVSQSLEFKGRIERESWVEQARILSSGGHTEFSRRVDRGEVDTNRET